MNHCICEIFLFSRISQIETFRGYLILWNWRPICEIHEHFWH